MCNFYFQVQAIFGRQSAPTNEFDAWCTSALSALNAQVDVPTFLAFLRDIESPYEVRKAPILEN